MTISFNLAPNVSLGEAVKAIQNAEAGDWRSRKRPDEFQGTARAFHNFAVRMSHGC